jgi:transcriptional regulator
MYVPKHFDIEDSDDALAVVRARVAGNLVIRGGGDLEASLIPWVLDRGVLRGHVARPNPLVRLLAEPTKCLVIFDVADAYISPSWYASKNEHHRVVPTWNYQSVHLHGSARRIDDETWIRAQVTALTTQQEVSLREPWAVADAPDDFIATMVKGIVGIEVTIERIEAKAKLSQNRSDADIEGVLDGLAERPIATSIRELMTMRSSPQDVR